MAPVAAIGGQRLAGRHGGGAARQPGEHHGLRQARHRQLAAQRSGGGGEGGHAGRQGVGDAAPVQPAQLLRHGAVQRQVARMQPRHVLPGGVGGQELRLDRIEVERGGVDQPRAGRAMRQQVGRHDRPGVEADRAGGEQPGAAQRDEVGRPRPGADEMDRHAGRSASAQVAHPSPIRGQGQPPAACQRRCLRHGGDAGHPRPPPATAWGKAAARPRAPRLATNCSGTPSRRAASASPASSRFQAGAASASAPPACCTSATIASAGQPRRQPMPATITAWPPTTASPSSPGGRRASCPPRPAAPATAAAGCRRAAPARPAAPPPSPP